MKPIYLFITTLVLCATFLSCKKDKAGIEKIKNSVSATMIPPGAHNSQLQSFSIDCQTEDIYECDNYSINYSISKSANRIDIELINVKKETVCLALSGKAECTILLGDLTDGTYELCFFLNGRKNIFQLVVSDKSYAISGNSSTMVKDHKYVWFTQLN